MSALFETWLELGIDLWDVARDQAKWSQATFGKDQDRGPIGALKHLEHEAREAQAAPNDVSEYADCFLLVLDAARRAGFSVRDLLTAAIDKQEINESREWPKPTSDEPVFHSAD